MAVKARAPKLINAFMARTNLGRVIKQVEEGETFIITKQGRPRAVVLGVKEYEDLLEVLAEENDPEFRRALRESARQIKHREISSLKALEAIYKNRRR